MISTPPCPCPPDPAPTTAIALHVEDDLPERDARALDEHAPIPKSPGVEPADADDPDGWYAPILDEPIPDADPADSH